MDPVESMDILYVHPHGHFTDEGILSAGALRCMNAFPGEKYGVFSHQLTAELVLNAKLIAIELYWSSSYLAVCAVVAFVRKTNPGVPVVIGGWSAGLCAGALKQKLGVDYVFSGEEDQTDFAAVASRLIKKDTGRPLPADNFDTSWFSLPSQIKSPSFLYHLSPYCRNELRSCVPCTWQRNKTKKPPRSSLPAAEEFRQYYNNLPDSQKNYAILSLAGLEMKNMAAAFEILADIADRQTIVLTCGGLPPNICEVLQKNRYIEICHIFPGNINDWFADDENNAQLKIIRSVSRFQKNGKVRFCCITSLDRKISELLINNGINPSAFDRPINWDLFHPQNNNEGLKQMENFSSSAQATIVMRYFSPKLYDLICSALDPLLTLPPPGNFQAAPLLYGKLLAGFARWKYCTLDSPEYIAVFLSTPPDAEYGELISSETLHKWWSGHTAACRFSVTYLGWNFTGKCPPGEKLSAFTILPASALGFIQNADPAVSFLLLPLPEAPEFDVAVTDACVEITGNIRELPNQKSSRSTKFSVSKIDYC